VTKEKSTSTLKETVNADRPNTDGTRPSSQKWWRRDDSFFFFGRGTPGGTVAVGKRGGGYKKNGTPGKKKGIKNTAKASSVWKVNKLISVNRKESGAA